MKVAILDSGIELPSTDMLARGERIKEVRSWVGVSIDDEKDGRLLQPDQLGCRDEIGHGTHIAGLLLDVAPEVDLYIAQIAHKVPVHPSLIAKVGAFSNTFNLFLEHTPAHPLNLDVEEALVTPL